MSSNTSLILHTEETFSKFIDSCHNITINIDGDDNDTLFHSINSKYYDLHELIKIKPDPSSIGILHTYLASIYKYHDDLVDTLSLYI